MKAHNIKRIVVAKSPTPNYLELDCWDDRGKCYHTEGKTLVAIAYGLVHGFGGYYDGEVDCEYKWQDLSMKDNPCDPMILAIYARVQAEGFVLKEGSVITPLGKEAVDETFMQLRIGRWSRDVDACPFRKGYTTDDWPAVDGSWFADHPMTLSRPKFVKMHNPVLTFKCDGGYEEGRIFVVYDENHPKVRFRIWGKPGNVIAGGMMLCTRGAPSGFAMLRDNRVSAYFAKVYDVLMREECDYDHPRPGERIKLPNEREAMVILEETGVLETWRKRGLYPEHK